nr:hypothetical protein [Streptomyces sp. WAC 06725]
MADPSSREPGAASSMGGTAHRICAGWGLSLTEDADEHLAQLTRGLDAA